VGLAGVIVLLIPLVVRSLYPSLLKALLIDEKQIVVDGAGNAFLESLPRRR
jgi:hypothetical protein